MKNIIELCDEGDRLYNSIMSGVLKEGKEYIAAIYENCNALRETGNSDNILLADIYQLLLEADTQFMNVQLFVVSHMIGNPKVETWGYNTFDDWELFDANKKINSIFMHLRDTNAFFEARKYMDNSPLVSSTIPNIYNVKDIDEPYTGIKSKHLEQLKNSQIFKDLTDIFIKYL